MCISRKIIIQKLIRFKRKKNYRLIRFRYSKKKIKTLRYKSFTYLFVRTFDNQTHKKKMSVKKKRAARVSFEVDGWGFFIFKVRYSSVMCGPQKKVEYQWTLHSKIRQDTSPDSFLFFKFAG